MSKPSEEKAGEQRIIKELRTAQLRLITPPNLLSHFSNFQIVQHDAAQDMFTLSFFEIQPPPNLGDKGKTKTDAPDTETQQVPAYCLARVVMSSVQFKKYIKMLQNNLERVEDKRKEAESKTEG